MSRALFPLTRPSEVRQSGHEEAGATQPSPEIPLWFVSGETELRRDALVRHGVCMDSADFDEVYPALGRLVLNSSHMEMRLRKLVGWLAQTDEASIIFDGQSVDWLIGGAKAMISELRCTQPFAFQDCDRFLAVLTQAQVLNPKRNFFVHGHWSTQCHDDECVLRPRKSVHRKGFRGGLREAGCHPIDGRGRHERR